MCESVREGARIAHPGVVPRVSNPIAVPRKERLSLSFNSAHLSSLHTPLSLAFYLSRFL